MNSSNTKRVFIENTKEKLNTQKYLNYEIKDIIFPALSNYVDDKSILFKIKKNIFNIFAIHHYKNYESLLSKHLTYDNLIIKSVKRESHEKMYNGYILKNKLSNIKTITQDLNDIKYKIYLPNIKEIKLSFQILKSLNLKSSYLFFEILYSLKRTRELNSKINFNIKNSIYMQGDYNFPNMIFLKKNEMNNKNLNSYTFQFFNLSQDNEYKSEQESFWLNSQVKNIIVWGNEYKEFLQKKLKNTKRKTNIIVSSHPLYNLEIKKNKVEIPKNNHIIICLNPPEKIKINYEFIKVIITFCKENKYTFSLRLHPIDSLNNYSKYISNKEYNSTKKKGIQVVNNSTIYFDLIVEGKIVLRYKNNKSYLNILNQVEDFFTNSKELKLQIEHINITKEREKKKIVEKDIFNI